MAKKRKKNSSMTGLDMNLFPPKEMKKLKKEQHSLRTGAHWRDVMKRQSAQYGKMNGRMGGK